MIFCTISCDTKKEARLQAASHVRITNDARVFHQKTLVYIFHLEMSKIRGLPTVTKIINALIPRPSMDYYNEINIILFQFMCR